jgi:hypothetical protein
MFKNLSWILLCYIQMLDNQRGEPARMTRTVSLESQLCSAPTVDPGIDGRGLFLHPRERNGLVEPDISRFSIPASTVWK